MRRFALSLLAALSLCAGSAQALTVGNDLVQRNTSDTFDRFSLAFVDLVLPKGTITSWSARARIAGNFALLVLSQNGPASFTVEGVFSGSAATNDETVTNAIDFDVNSGWVLGLYQEFGKIWFNNAAAATTGYTANNGQPGGVSVGDSFSTTLLGTGRDYSLQVEVNPVPLPAMLPALALAFAGLGGAALRRRKTAH